MDYSSVFYLRGDLSSFKRKHSTEDYKKLKH